MEVAVGQAVCLVNQALKNIKNGKAASDIPGEYLKYASQSDLLVSEIVKLFNTIWNTHSIPSDWGHSKLITLWKGAAKGSKNNPEAYRGLQVGSSLCKLMITIIINRLENWYEGQLSEQQQGFRSSRGTTDGIYITKTHWSRNGFN